MTIRPSDALLTLTTENCMPTTPITIGLVLQIDFYTLINYLLIQPIRFGFIAFESYFAAFCNNLSSRQSLRGGSVDCLEMLQSKAVFLRRCILYEITELI
jgi:hypothetical protein